jgi:probable FeS assembly SUF system protein SufT
LHISDGEIIALKRDIEGVRIPAGDRFALPAGTECRITQSLGGSFTIYVEGHLFRVDGKDADALGKTAEKALELPPGAGDADVDKLVWDQLRTCYDPEIPIDIVELGLVYACEVDKLPDGKRSVAVKMTLTAPGCGMGDYLVADVREKLLKVPTVSETRVELVFDPPWNQSMMSEAARLQSGLI